MTRAFAMAQTPRLTRAEVSKAKAAARYQKRTDQFNERQSERRAQVQDRIYSYVTSKEKELIYAETLDCLIYDLMSANVCGQSLRGESDTAIERAFREIQDVLLLGVPKLTLHIEVGNAMLGVKEEYWPMTPF